jgi:hypothetical protein
MKKSLLNLKGVQELSKNEQKNIAGGRRPLLSICGGDGSFIFVNGKKVCCYIPSSGYYIC